MSATRTYDITYPGVAGGMATTAAGADPKTVDQLIADAGGTRETTRAVRPSRMEYGYVPVARD